MGVIVDMLPEIVAHCVSVPVSNLHLDLLHFTLKDCTWVEGRCGISEEWLCVHGKPPCKDYCTNSCNRNNIMYLLRHRCKYTTGIIELGCGRVANKARGAAECLIRPRDHIRVQ